MVLNFFCPTFFSQYDFLMIQPCCCKGQYFSILLGSFVLGKSMVGGHLEVIWKKLSGDVFRENGMCLESPFKELGIILEAGRHGESRLAQQMVF